MANQAGGAPTLSGLVQGASTVAQAFAGRARGAQPAVIDGVPGAVWAPGGKLRAVFDFLIIDYRIVAIEVIAEPELVEQLDVTFLTS
jgi:RNA polymerase sigma-70 factor (ECF subfamily)